MAAVFHLRPKDVRELTIFEFDTFAAELDRSAAS